MLNLNLLGEMAKKLKPWKQLTIGEQNYYYYVYKGYSKMDSSWNIPNKYKRIV